MAWSLGAVLGPDLSRQKVTRTGGPGQQVCRRPQGGRRGARRGMGPFEFVRSRVIRQMQAFGRGVGRCNHAFQSPLQLRHDVEAGSSDQRLSGKNGDGIIGIW